MFIYVTGIAGAGKSEVFKELKNRGYEVYGTDEDQLAGFYNNKTGERMVGPSLTAKDRTPQWRNLYTWKVDRKEIEKLAAKAKDKKVFLCGVAANEEDFLDIFNKLVALVIDDDTLKQRITNRSNNDFGKVSHEMKTILEWQKNTKSYYKKRGYIEINAIQPIDKVVDEILSKV